MARRRKREDGENEVEWISISPVMMRKFLLIESQNFEYFRFFNSANRKKSQNRMDKGSYKFLRWWDLLSLLIEL